MKNELTNPQCTWLAHLEEEWTSEDEDNRIIDIIADAFDEHQQEVNRD